MNSLELVQILNTETVKKQTKKRQARLLKSPHKSNLIDEQKLYVINTLSTKTLMSVNEKLSKPPTTSRMVLQH